MASIFYKPFFSMLPTRKKNPPTTLEASVHMFNINAIILLALPGVGTLVKEVEAERKGGGRRKGRNAGSTNSCHF